MKLYVSTITGIKRFFLISSSNSVSTASGKASTLAAPICRRFSSGTLLLPLLLLLLLLLLLGIVFPFLFVKITFSVLQSPPPGLGDCLVWRILGGIDPSNASLHNIYIGKNAKLRGLGVGLDCGYKYKRLFIRGSVGNSKLREELIRAFVEANEGGTNENDLQVPTESFDELVRQMASNPLDIKDFAFGTKAMLLRMEHKVNSARRREEIYWHLASHGVPKSLHCVCLKLAEQYAMNSVARSHLPPPEYTSHLTNPSFHHVVLLTDNVLGASVVVSSAVQNSVNPEKMVFHIVTDKKTYTPMHAWFAINPIESAVVEVKGLHQYDWSEDVNSGVQDMLEIQRLIWSHYYNKLKEENFQHVGELKRILEALRPSILSLLNHLRIYIPELFPDLNKIVFLDDDVVVQHDISALWEFDLNKKVVGAVANSWCGENCCPGRRYRNYLNFSHSIISSNFDADRCAWLYGMNIFDLEAWRKTNITKNYHQWLKLNLDSGLELWQPGVLPPALLAFEGYVQPIDPLWHVAGLGYAPPEAHEEILETAAVLHFSGPAKPWLVIGSPKIGSSLHSCPAVTSHDVSSVCASSFMGSRSVGMTERLFSNISLKSLAALDIEGLINFWNNFIPDKEG